MLLRADDGGVIAIGQPSHAWLSGQLARAWGNETFSAPDPREEVCLAAEQHDVGMAPWELSPTHDPETGLPHSFMAMPLALHLEQWRAGPRSLLPQSRYAALLACMHGIRLYARRDLQQMPREEREQVRTFLAEQERFQEDLVSSLRGEPRTAGLVEAERLSRNSQLIWTWDFLSLALCLDWAPCAAHEVPTKGGAVDVELTAPGAGEQVQVMPWPFSAEKVKVHCEGKRLKPRYESVEVLRRALARAPYETLEFDLVP